MAHIPLTWTALCLVVLGCLLASLPASGREIAGVHVPETVMLPGETAPLVLNGAGVRTKFFIKVYVGALYLPQPETRVEVILASPAPKSVRLYVVYSAVSTAQLVEVSNESFAANHTAEELKPLQPRIEQFNRLLRTMHRGDVLRFDYLPQEGTQVWLNQELLGTVAGADMHRAMLKNWLGPRAVDGRLKKAMLGSTG
jgi:hypothetical protein